MLKKSLFDVFEETNKNGEKFQNYLETIQNNKISQKCGIVLSGGHPLFVLEDNTTGYISKNDFAIILKHQENFDISLPALKYIQKH